MAVINRGSCGIPTVVLILLLASTPFTIGAEWAQIAIQDFESVAGTWEGTGVTASGRGFILKISFREDGLYSFIAGTRSGTGTMRIDNGTIKWKSTVTGDPVTATLHKDQKGKRVLKGIRGDGLTFTVKPAKK